MLIDFSPVNLNRLLNEEISFLVQCPKTKVVHNMCLTLYNSYADNDTRCIIGSLNNAGDNTSYVMKDEYLYTYRYRRTVITTVEDFSRILESQDFKILPYNFNRNSGV